MCIWEKLPEELAASLRPHVSRLAERATRAFPRHRSLQYRVTDLFLTSPYYSQMDPQAPQAINGQGQRLDE